jgi:hypothetical protein
MWDIYLSVQRGVNSIILFAAVYRAIAAVTSALLPDNKNCCCFVERNE